MNLNFYLLNLFFLLIPFSFLSAQTPLTRGEVFDFDIGDEFEYFKQTMSDPYPIWEFYRVIGKSFTNNGATLTYSFTYEKKEYNGDASIILTDSQTKWISYYNLATPLFDRVFSCMSPDSLDSAHYVMGNMFGRRANKETNQVSALLSACYSVNVWGEGLGLVNSSALAPGDGIDDQRYLIYYKKGNEVFGNAQVGLEDQSESSMLPLLFPQPASDFLNVKFDHDFSGLKGQFKVVNTLGKEVLHGTLRGDFQIGLSSLPQGCYLLLLETEDWQKGFRFLKIE